MGGIQKVLRGMFEFLENSRVSILSLLLTFFFSFHFRTFIEVYLDGEKPIVGVFEIFSHYSVFYLCFGLALLLLFQLCLKEFISNITKVVLPLFLITGMVPIVDSLFEGWKIFHISYFIPGVHDDLLMRFLTFGGTFDVPGMTPGIRLEGALVLFVCYHYFRFKGKSIFSSLMICFYTYTLAFLFCSMPFMMKAFVAMFGVPFLFEPKVTTDSLACLTLLFGAALCLLNRRDLVVAYLKRARVGFLIHGLLLFALGVVLHIRDYHVFLLLSQESLFIWIFSFCMLFFMWLALMSLGAWGGSCEKGDVLQEQTLFIAKQDLKISTIVLCLGACFFASLISFEMLFLCSILLGNQFLVSFAPLRLARFAFVRNFHFAILSLVIVLMGYICGFTDAIVSVMEFMFLFWSFFVLSFIGCVGRDYGCEDGNLVTFLGEGQARMVIGGVISLGYAILAIAYQNTVFCVGLLFLVPCNYLAVKLIKKPIYVVMGGYFIVLIALMFMLLQ